MPSLPKGQRHPVELRERAIRLVLDHQQEYPSQWKAIESVAEKLDIHRETLRLWVRRAEIDDGRRPGLSTDERVRMKELERENRELRRANEILKAASHFFGAELDRQSKR
jgi:transposase